MALGRRIAAALPRKAVVLLIGTLGAGKTTIAKGIVAGLHAAAPEEVSSPTFTLVHEYGTPPERVYHVDLYRLDTVEEVRGIGIEEILDRKAIVLLEWAERFPELLPSERVEIRLESASVPGDASGEEGAEPRTIRIAGLTVIPPGAESGPLTA
jgi:tRNA threonylcarbamoyladenosine biosynthesis protein TsaE